MRQSNNRFFFWFFFLTCDAPLQGPWAGGVALRLPKHQLFGGETLRQARARVREDGEEEIEEEEEEEEGEEKSRFMVSERFEG